MKNEKIEDIGDGWCDKHKLSKSNKGQNFYEIYKCIDGRTQHDNWWWDDWLFQMNWKHYNRLCQKVVQINCVAEISLSISLRKRVKE